MTTNTRVAIAVAVAIAAGLVVGPLPSRVAARRATCANGSRGLILSLVAPPGPLPIGTGAPLIRSTTAASRRRQLSFERQLGEVRVGVDGHRAPADPIELAPGLYRLAIRSPLAGRSYEVSGLDAAANVTFGPTVATPAAPRLDRVAGHESRRSHGGLIATDVRFASPAPAGVFAVLLYEDGSALARTWIPLAPGATVASQRGGVPACGAVPPESVTTVRPGRVVRAAWLTDGGALSGLSNALPAQRMGSAE